tara:strand:+ start:355 stop:657 length:303 start_codon:yes stop_codon:yes gene_type:complete
MPRCKKKIRVKNRSGLHARPAALFVRLANTFRSRVWLRKGKESADGKSIMHLLSLAVEAGSTVELVTYGSDAKEALKALSELLKKDDEQEEPKRAKGVRN